MAKEKIGERLAKHISDIMYLNWVFSHWVEKVILVLLTLFGIYGIYIFGKLFIGRFI